MRRPFLPPVIVLLAVGLLASGCGAADRDGRGVVRVLAAASLTESFTAMAAAFEDTHPGVTVTIVSGPSSGLVRQIVEGAPADVLASADDVTMARLGDEGGTLGAPTTFATNQLAIITEAGNPAGIVGLADLSDPDLVVVTCDPDVPIGRYAVEVLARAGVAVTPRSYEVDVKAVVRKVTLGEADAGIVYATDVRAAGAQAAGVAIPDEVNVRATYPIVVTRSSRNPAAAEAFVAFVLADEGQAILATAGFGAP